jgi:uncharacterized protein YecT (DUF1311 family)
MRMFLMAILLAGLDEASGLQAQQLSADYAKCAKIAVTNYDFGQCSGAEIRRQEELLAVVWGKMTAEIKEWTGPARAAMVKEQRAWTSFKDDACRYFDNHPDFGREGTVIHYGECKAKVIASRVTALNDLIEFLKPR